MSSTAVPDLSSRTDFIPKEDYLSRDFVLREKERLWPACWLLACREEELNAPGKFVTFDIAEESIIISRDESGRIQAFFNVCPHRGRRLTTGCGHAKRGFYCNYHGWQWNLDGSNKVMIDGEQWTGIGPADVGLRKVRLDTWGGFVFVNIDGKADPLLDWLKPVVDAWTPYRLEDMRYRWIKTTKVNCNWKVALEAFLEAYHAQTTHRQVNNADGGATYGCKTFGRHSMFYPIPVMPMGAPNPNSKYLPPINAELFEGVDDLRVRTYLFLRTVAEDLDCMYTHRLVEAARRLPERVAADASSQEMHGALLALEREISLAEGIDLSHLSDQQYHALGSDWNVFPNVAMLPTLNGVLIYRARPYNDDPDTCLFDIFPLERYAPGTEPEIVRESFENWRDGAYPRIFVQDFDNVEDVQSGMKSAGFPGAMPSPMSEKVVWNLHREIREMVLA